MSVSIKHIGNNQILVDFEMMLIGQLSQLSRIMYGTRADQYPQDISVVLNQLAAYVERELPDGVFVLAAVKSYAIVVYGGDVSVVKEKVRDILSRNDSGITVRDVDAFVQGLGATALRATESDYEE